MIITLAYSGTKIQKCAFEISFDIYLFIIYKTYCSIIIVPDYMVHLLIELVQFVTTLNSH